MRNLVNDLVGEDLYGILKYAAKMYGTQAAITDCTENPNDLIDHSYQAMLEDVEKLSAFLQSSVKERTHIVLCAENSYNWIISFFAVVCSGNVVIPLDINMTEDELNQAIKAVDAQIVITEKHYLQAAILNYTLSEFVSLKTTACDKFKHKNIKDILSILLMTSGVTLSSRYVMLSQQNLIYSTLNGVDAVPIPSGKTVLSILPLHHSYEISCGLLYHICCGSHIYINDKKTNFLRNIRTIEPQFLTAVPSIIYSLLSLLKTETALRGSSCVQKIEIIYCGGAAVDPAVIKEFRQNGIFVLQGYGMTECSPAITINRMDDFTADTVGKAFRFVDIQIREGEIYVKAPNVMLGYYKNPNATAEVLQNGWLRTGDTGYFDKNGHLILCGRVKNVIVLKNGENVYPEELEEKIFQYGLEIKYCKVYEENGGISVDLYVPGQTECSVMDMIKIINSRVSNFKRIKNIHLLREMPPVTALGKPFRRHSDDSMIADC